MNALLIALPALVCAGLAMLLRRRLSGLALSPWLGVTLIGTGIPVLAGQVISLLMAPSVSDAIAACEAAGSGDCGIAGMALVQPLVAGLSGGLGWLAGAIVARLGPASRKD